MSDVSVTNENPLIFEVQRTERPFSLEDFQDDKYDAIDAREVFDHIRDIYDPEHPHTLEALHVVEESQIVVDDHLSRVHVRYTPTIPHCGMATLIGLAIKVKLWRCMPPRFKIHVSIAPGTHNQEEDINKQLADKERVAAAMENPVLSNLVNKIIARPMSS